MIILEYRQKVCKVCGALATKKAISSAIRNNDRITDYYCNDHIYLARDHHTSFIPSGISNFNIEYKPLRDDSIFIEYAKRKKVRALKVKRAGQAKERKSLALSLLIPFAKKTTVNSLDTGYKYTTFNGSYSYDLYVFESITFVTKPNSENVIAFKNEGDKHYSWL